MLDTLAFGMGFFEFLRGALEVGTEVLQLRCHLLLEGELLHVDGMVRVGGDGRVGVLLPRERLGPADDDLDAVVLDRAGEGLTHATLGDECLYGGFHLRTQTLQGRFGFVTCYLCSEKLVNYIVVLLCALRLIVVLHNAENFVLGFDLTKGLFCVFGNFPPTVYTSSNQNFRG